jgi:hypothetical protein
MNDIGQLVEQHRKFLESSNKLTDLMLKRAQFSDFNEVDRLSRNRGRLISILNSLKQGIESLITKVGIEQIKKRADYQEIEDWVKELDAWSERTLEKDLEVSELLSAIKKDTSLEISKTFKSKQQFKGYNLNSTKR